MDASRTPAAVAISAVGVLITGLCLVTADRLNASPAARTLAVLAVASGSIATVGALSGSLLTRFRTSAAAALTSCLAVLLATAAALIVVLEPPSGDEPAMTLSVSGVPGETRISVLLELPGLPSRSLVDASLTGFTAGAGQARVARVVVTADRDGYAEVHLQATDSDQFRSLKLEAAMSGRTCTATIPLEDALNPDEELDCR
ncbi:hypothetical protein ACTI_53310 [Actinoplanes sp. OR16]|uniref:hypothetical protein n=1 Tax=Actinoplanes sp. OR16 TaxID=946334 RepID=UPI000F6CCB17|nr:hypothetical protein [Actinoplanes sp. OR16]BBH68646.1 hypothetical protein ACTI_53310 [Actinoplanes sp. OR16]